MSIKPLILGRIIYITGLFILFMLYARPWLLWYIPSVPIFTPPQHQLGEQS